MDGDEITLEDLLDDEPASGAPPTSFRQLLADGMPLHCGLDGLAVIERMPDPGTKLAPVRKEYLRLLEIQRRHAGAK